MTKTIHCIVSVATVVAILAGARIAAAQDFVGQGGAATTTDAQLATECLVECNKRIVPCASAPTDVMLTCGDIPACIGMSNSFVEIINMTCDRCRAGERECVASETPAPAPAPTVVLTPWVMPTATAPAPKPMPAPPLTKEQLCKQQGGIIWGTACYTLRHAKQEIEKLQADLAALQKRVDDQGSVPGLEERLRRINERLSALEAALQQKPPSGETPPNGDLTLKELNERVRKLQDTFDTKVQAQVQGLSNRATEQDDRLNKDEAKIQELEDRINGVFGFELNAAIGIHALVPYEHVIWGVMPELFWLPEVADGWRLELGGGYGYAGQLHDETLRVGTVMIGVMPRVYDGFHLGFGVTGEWRTNPSERTKYASYGGYVEPKYCPGNDMPAEQADTPLETPPHFFCLGARAALEATIFQHPIPPLAELPLHPDAGETYTRPDGSFMFFVGYAFLP